MTMNHTTLRQLFTDFWKERGHQEVPPAPLVLKEDPTTLFTSSGMQPLVIYLAGANPHPLGKRLFDIQPCIRTQDMDKVGDNRHDTFFEMMGNWSLGDYFKKEQLSWYFEFLTKVIKLPKNKLHFTIFEGDNMVPRDVESAKTWKDLGVEESHIHYYGIEANWWSRSGTPDKMPVGEIGGPDSEVFYDFGTPHDERFGKECQPNCECGRFMEIGNSVFIQYKKIGDGTLQELPQKNVDFGGGIERMLAAINNNPDIFETDVFSKIIKAVEDVSGKKYYENKSAMRIIADHIKASTFLIAQGVKPSNKEQGYILRRLLRKATIKFKNLEKKINEQDIMAVAQSVIETYKEVYFDDTTGKIVDNEIGPEIFKFTSSLDKGLKEIEKLIQLKGEITGKIAFDLYQSYGFPLEITEEILKNKGQKINRDEFVSEFNKHKELSRSASAGMFKGGLADQSVQTTRYHTATHLINQTLTDLLGSDVSQVGSNITGERLRFDFTSSRKPTDEEIKEVENIVNKKVEEGLDVYYKDIPKDEALKLGAKSFFKQKYPDIVKVYFIGRERFKTVPYDVYSKEFCGGPHVKNTKEIGKISIYKFEKIGNNIYRIYAKNK
ncbi:MAG: alanine--tRNA ligase [Candidatus Roizmanbacteria bacterium]|nr:MAG: alanine--tRNA ligase [Candidatus Roizmanbacteria bacterium]